MPTTNNTPHTVEALLRIVQERDAEVVFVELMVDKLALVLLRARRAQYGRACELLDDRTVRPSHGQPRS